MFKHPLLTEAQRESYKQFREFAAEHVEPYALLWEKQQAIPRDIIDKCSKAGFVGGIIPKEYGGSGWDTVTFGCLNEAMGAASSSLCALFTVQNMVAMTLVKWGSPEQQHQWLEPMAKGEIIAAFAMTEPKVGSDLQGIETNFTPAGNSFLLNGTKRWITMSGIADIFLVFGKCGDKSAAAIVRSNTPGVKITPIRDLLGFKGAHLSQLDFTDVEIKPGDMIGKPGMVIQYVSPYGLHYGRISTAWSAAGLIRACVESSATYSSQRRAFNSPIMEHGTIREILTDMVIDMEAAQFMCLAGVMAEDSRAHDAMERVLMAKYFSSRAAVKAASNAVQVMGAAGCHEENLPATYYKNAKIMQIIEGTDQVLQKALGKSFCRKFAKK